MRFRALGPYLLLVPPAVAVLLVADRFPAVMPVHWNASGVPNGFLPRTPLTLELPVLFIAGLLLFMDLIVAGGARVGPPPVTESVHRLLGPIRWTLGLLATPSAFAPLWGPLPVLVGAGVMVAVVLVQIARSPRLVPPGMEAGWHGGLFYSNAADPRLVVPKRSGLGWTFNFARPVAWVLLVAILLLPIALLVAIGHAR